MNRIILFGLAVILLAGCAGLGKPNFEQTAAQSGVPDKLPGDRLTSTEFNAVKNTADTADALATVNQGKLASEAALETALGIGIAHSGANSDITSITGLTTPLGAAYGGAEADTSSMNGVLQATNGVMSEITFGSMQVLGDIGGGPIGLDIDTDLSSVSASDDTLASAKEIKDYVDAATGGWSITPLSSAPGSPETGKVYVADSEGGGWNPCSSDATTDYLVLYNGAVYLPLWKVDGTPIVQTAAPGTPKTGWTYWADANGTWDPDTEVTGTDPYQVYYNGIGYVSVRMQDGTFLALDTAQDPTIDDPDNWTLSGRGMYGGCWTANATGSASLPAVVSGMHLTIDVEGAYTPTIDVDGTEEIYLNGTTCGAGKYIIGSGTTGDSVVLRYRVAGDWKAIGTGFTCEP